MTSFVDANVIVYAAIGCDCRPGCLEVLEAVAGGAASGRTSASVLEEVGHLERSGKLPGIEGLTERAPEIFSPPLPMTDGAFRAARSIDAPRPGTNDRVHAGTCFEHGARRAAPPSIPRDRMEWPTITATGSWVAGV